MARSRPEAWESSEGYFRPVPMRQVEEDFASIVNSGLMKTGEVNILTGVHGFVDGSVLTDLSLFEADVARFAEYPGVNILNVAEMSPAAISNVVNGSGTIIGGFCNSGACLAPLIR
jgi:hypothetical protein